MDTHELRKTLEEQGVVFCREGSDTWKAAGVMKHDFATKRGEDIWVCLVPLDLHIDDNYLRSDVQEVLEWCANNNYETAR